MNYRKGRTIFAQGEEADKVFYIQSGKVKLTVVPSRVKKRSSVYWNPRSFLAKDV
jgi:CRP/FNR family cyclic AMP-dependent transcriptional regulator